MRIIDINHVTEKVEPMAAGIENQDIKDAAVRGAIEILINPEFGTDWILNEVLSDIPDEDLGDQEATAEQVEELIMDRFKTFAAELAAELPAAKRVGLEEYLGL
jgi:hypothetical protein